MTKDLEDRDNEVSQDAPRAHTDRLPPPIAAELGHREGELRRALEEHRQLEIDLLASTERRQAYEDARVRRYLANTLARIRKLKGISQATLALMMNTAQSAISDIEKGSKDPRISTLQRFARALGLELEVRLSTDSWTILYSWNRRAFSYGATVQLQVDDVKDDLWVAFIHDRMADAHDDLRDRGRNSMPSMVVSDPKEDRYLTDKDLLQISLPRLAQTPTLALTGD